MAGGLFHWRHDPSEERSYSLKKDDYPRLPLYNPDAPANKNSYLNEVFWLVLDDVPNWRSIGSLYAESADKVLILASSE